VRLLERELPTSAADPAEALIKEAHQRKRRRRFLLAGIVIVVVAAAVGGYLVARPGPRSKPPAPTVTVHPTGPAGPVVDKAAFVHHGRLAFVSQGTLWVLGGPTGSLRPVTTPGLVPANPTFSPDGKWLAFIASKETEEDYGSQVVSSELWLANADGTHARPVTAIASNTGIAPGTAFGWDSHADLYAVPVGSATSRPFYTATAIDLVSPTGPIRQLVGRTHVVSAVWSPDGSSMAVSTEQGSEPVSPLSATLATYPVRGGTPTVWESDYAGFIVPAGWWPTWGIGYTTVGSGGVPGGSAAADGSPLYAIARPGAAPRQLGTTLMNESTGTASVTAGGWLAFVEAFGDNAGRIIWSDKQVVVCSPVTTACSPILHPAGTVTDNPVWSPTGSTLAYVEAPSLPGAGFPQPVVSSWYGAHQLYFYDPVLGSTTEATQHQGATVPQWSTDGSSLLYVSDNGLWLSSNSTAAPVEIARPLFTPGDWPSYYGQVAFASQFSWASGS
jgi:Tol biopolymer transport system component